MRIAVVGAGSAGHMAVAHVSHYFPTAAVTHIYDPHTPTIGVGEGTTPVFTEWAKRVLGWDFARLEAYCDATRKAGIVFEGWGPEGTDYTHLFATSEGEACHLSAALLASRLAARSSAEVLAERVREITVREGVARITLETRELEFEFVFDARGFPRVLTDEHVNLSCVATDSALLTRGPPRAPRDRTRAVARPHGWIFVIPLRTDTSYGYIHRRLEGRLALHDFEQFLDDEAVETQQPLRSVHFPNFRRVRSFDGVVFAIGNRAGFVEPLEATALGMIVVQLRLATFWLLDRVIGLSGGQAGGINSALNETVDEVAAFIGWHYAKGAPHATPFWDRAVEMFDEWLGTRTPEQRSRFHRYIRRGMAYPRELAYATSIAELDRLQGSQIAHSDTFGGFLDLSFAKVGHGIDWS